MAVQMPGQAVQADIERTFKSREIEGYLDLFFYRKVGFQLARFFAWAGFTPNGVTLLGAVIGIVAGHLYFYRDLTTNVLGMCLHVFANAMDNADGQLARLISRYSPIGRMLDGVCDNLVFASVYIHLGLRFVAEGGSVGIWILVLVAGLSHSWQSAAAEFCRGAYLYFAAGRVRAIESSLGVREDYEQRTWRAQFLEKLLLKIQISYVHLQEMLCPRLVHLERISREAFVDGIPQWFRDAYRQNSKPMIRFSNLLRTNSHMALLFALLFLGRPEWYFVVEVTALNLLLAFVVVRQQALSRKLESLITARARG